MKRLAVVLSLAAGAAGAQGTVETLDPGANPGGFVETIEPQPGILVSPLTGEPIGPVAEPRVRVEIGAGAALRWLDKVSGDLRDIVLSPGESARLGRLDVTLGECRYPVNNPTGEAFAWVEIRTEGRDEADFAGWMLASSPALSALDHPRYDVWVIRCTTA